MDNQMNGKSKLTNGSTTTTAMNGNLLRNNDDRNQPIDLIDDNSDDLYNDSYMDIDSDPIGNGSNNGQIYSPMMITHHHHHHHLQQQHHHQHNNHNHNYSSSQQWDDGILMGADSGCIIGGNNNNCNNKNNNNNNSIMPISQLQQLMSKLIHQDFYNKFDDLLDNDDLD